MLISETGEDTMYCDALFMYGDSQGGDDTLDASLGGPKNGGADLLTGNDGADLFITKGNIQATITDYNEAEGDKIIGAHLPEYYTTNANE